MSQQRKNLPRFRLLAGLCLLLLSVGILLFSLIRVNLQTSIVLSDGIWVRTETYAGIGEPAVTYDQLVPEDPRYPALVQLFAGQSYRKCLDQKGSAHDLASGQVTFLTLDFTADGAKTLSLTLTSDGSLRADGVLITVWPFQPGTRDLFQKAQAILAS